MTPRRLTLACTAIAIAGFFSVSGILCVRPGHPMAQRTDVFFQSDAGGLLQDAVLNLDNRARGTHPLVYPLWTRPLHALAVRFQAEIDPEVTVVFVSRWMVAIGAGIGVGALAGALARRGLSPLRTLAVTVLLVVANGHTLAAIPDHFGFSVGGIGLAYATVLSEKRAHTKIAILAILALLLFGITVTNITLPAGLIVLILARRHWQRRKWFILAVLVGLMVAVAASVRIAMLNASVRERVAERISLYLTVRLVENPVAALGYTFRGFSDAVVAPTPNVSRHNLDRVPMLTYEREDRPRAFWPHDLLQSLGACAWLGFLIWGGLVAWRDESLRTAILGAVGWIVGNAVFHNVWGDEYFLYSPHYVLPLVLLAGLGFRNLPAKLLIPPLIAVVVAALHTLRNYHQLLSGIPE